MKRAMLVLAVAACNQTYDLQPTTLTDSDGDGQLDTEDNCPFIANVDQHDLDGDNVGDVCDNCMIVANPDQQARGDADALGDACDPHPAREGDCLLVVDLFRDPDQISAHWRTLSDVTSPDVRIAPGSVTITPTGDGIAFLATDPELQGVPVDVIAQGRLPVLSVDADQHAQVSAVTNMSTLFDGNKCMLRSPQRPIAQPEINGGLIGASLPLVPAPVRDSLLFRLSVEDMDPLLLVRCRIDYGVAAAGRELKAQIRPVSTGAPGVLTTRDAFELNAIAFSRFMPGESCPATVVR
ncbi:MAG: hypothetical protein HOV81_44180 [Kofleriaceae bacterium]|nr:hypothetical protein [Kofleriaceae bacterium]